MMKPYSLRNHITAPGLIFLIIGSVLLGGLFGVAAYFISTFFYFLVIFPVIIGLAAMFAYGKLVLQCKVRHLTLTFLLSIVTGLTIATAFYATPYTIFRRDLSRSIQKEYLVDARTASRGVDWILVEETGSGGFFGYMRLRARAGSTYDQYLFVNYSAVQLFSFELSTTSAWLYWGLESLLFTIPCALVGFGISKRPFSESSNDWYDPYQKQIGTVHLENKELLSSYLKSSDIHKLSEIIIPEGNFEHPCIEIYSRRTKNNMGDVLLEIKETRRISTTVVRRKELSQWEIPLVEYQDFERLICENS